ncbi:hypothetical protein AOLI_G00083480 [Acnodon oligacanthus]
MLEMISRGSDPSPQQAYSSKSPLHSVPACSGLPFEWEFQVIIILPGGRQHTALITLFPLCVTPHCLTLEQSHVGHMQERFPLVNQSREPEEQTLCGPAEHLANLLPTSSTLQLTVCTHGLRAGGQAEEEEEAWSQESMLAG